MGRPTRIRASNWPIGGSDWPVGGSRTVNRRYWQTGGTRSNSSEMPLKVEGLTSIFRSCSFRTYPRLTKLGTNEFAQLFTPRLQLYLLNTTHPLLRSRTCSVPRLLHACTPILALQPAT